MLTVDDVKMALPSHMKSVVTQELVDKVNNAATDPIVAEQIRNNFLSYPKILQEGKFKIEDYLSAITYCSYKLMNLSNQEAYAKTFPDRYAKMIAAGKSAKDISSYVSAYHKGKLVNLILEQVIIPAWLLHQDTYHKAIAVQAEIMMTAKSDMARTKAADSILNHLSKPEEKGPLLNLNVGDNSGIKELKEALFKLAESQKYEIEVHNVSPREIAASQIYDSTN